MTETQPSPAAPALGSLTRIPGFDYGLDYAKSLYSYGKASTSILPYGIPELIQTAETKVVETAVPLLKKHRAHIETADQYAASKIDAIEQLAVETKAALASNVAAIPEIPAVKLGILLAARAESSVTRPLQRGAGIVSDVVDVVFPDDDDHVAQEDDWIAAMGKIYAQIKTGEAVQPNPTPVTPTSSTDVVEKASDDAAVTDAAATTANQVLPGKELLATIAQYQQLATKTNTRAAKMAMLKLKDAQRRAEDKVSTMKQHTVDLIAYAKVNIDAQALTTCEAVGLAAPPQLDELPGLAACKLAEIQAAAEAQKAAVLATLDPAKAFASAKSEQAYAQAERLTQVTTEYITVQRTLVATALADAAETTKASIATRIDPVQAFVKQTLDDSATFEVFIAKMEALKLQATAVTAKMQQQLRGNETVVSVTQRALSLYAEFEDNADPYTFHVLSLIRAYATAKLDLIAAETSATEDPSSVPSSPETSATEGPSSAPSSPETSATEDPSSLPSSPPGLGRVTSTSNLAASVPNRCDVVLPEFDDAEEGTIEGLVLTVNPTRTITAPTTGSGMNMDMDMGGEIATHN